MTRNPSPSPDLATPRPWTAPSWSPETEAPPVVRYIHHDAQGRKVTQFVAEFFEKSGQPPGIAHTNATLATEAVNAYDRLRAIEAAARDVLTLYEHEFDRTAVRRLRAALEGGTE